jgi:hypothetical protein
MIYSFFYSVLPRWCPLEHRLLRVLFHFKPESAPWRMEEPQRADAISGCFSEL